MTDQSSNLTTGRTDVDQFNLPSSQRISARGSMSIQNGLIDEDVNSHSVMVKSPAAMDMPGPITRVSVNGGGGVSQSKSFGGIPKKANTSANANNNDKQLNKKRQVQKTNNNVNNN